MGFAKKKLFGQPPGRWPLLQKLVEKGVLLSIDLAYAELQVPRGTEEEAAVFCGLLAFERKGHLCLEIDAMSELHPLLQELICRGAKGKKRLYLPKNAHLEEQIVGHLIRLLAYPTRADKVIVQDKVTDEQKTAIENALKFPLSLITGGPGTGKTYAATQIVLNAKSSSVILAAPTGRAAAHLEDKLKVSCPSIRAGTLHSFLIKESSLDADLVIVDESSMIDPPLFGQLLGAIKPPTTLVLMGDCNQLPAIKGGSVFADLVASKDIGIPCTTLSKCMRSDHLEILELASSILRGEAKDIRNIDLGIEEGNLEKIYQKLWQHTKAHFPQNWLKEMNRFRILSCLRKGPLGVDALNAFFYEKFSLLTDQFPIMITRNDRRTGLCNGDMGVLIKDREALFPGERRFSIHELPPYEYAYCISVHKSQGSEYDHVLFLVPEGSEVFGREVLYTAVTRAKTKLEIDGDPTQIALALARTSGKISGIRDRLRVHC